MSVFSLGCKLLFCRYLRVVAGLVSGFLRLRSTKFFEKGGSGEGAVLDIAADCYFPMQYSRVSVRSKIRFPVIAGVAMQSSSCSSELV